MDSKTNKRKSDATAPKLILIGVLALLFVGVLYLQFGRTKKSEPAAKSAVAAKTKAAANNATAQAKSSSPQPRNERKALGSLSQWTSPDIAKVVVYDPFALPAAFPQPAAAATAEAIAAKSGGSPEEQAKQLKAIEDETQKMQAQLETLRHQGVHVILKGRDEYVAVIGDQEIRVGDEINGFKVVSIDSRSVKVTWEPGQ